MSLNTITGADCLAQARQGIAPFFPRGATPSAQDTAKAKSDALGILDWLGANLANHRASADIAREFEDLLFNIGSIRMLWALLTDEDAARHYLTTRGALLRGAPFIVQCAVAKAESREHEERAAMFELLDTLRATAERLRSQRLGSAADVLEQMQGFFRVEPEAPAKAARQKSGQKAASARHNRTQELRARILDAMDKMPGSMSKNHKALQVAPLALKLNKEARHPFNWLNERQAEEYAREQLKPSKKRGAIRA